MPSVVPDCPVEITVESDPKKFGDQGELAAEYRATEASGISVGPLEDSVPNVVRPKPGAALSESHGSARNWSKRLSACSLRPPVKLIAPAVTPAENSGTALSLGDRELSIELASWDCATARRPGRKRASTVRVPMIL
jgi:hypothetical protein